MLGANISKDTPKIRPYLSSYPKTACGASQRAFKSRWLDSFSWLEYFTDMDACLGYPCRVYGDINHEPLSDTTLALAKEAYCNSMERTLASCHHYIRRQGGGGSSFKVRRQQPRTLVTYLEIRPENEGSGSS